jgi:hypothetical protein
MLTSKTGFGVKSGGKISSLPGGAMSRPSTKLSAASCCSIVGCHAAGKRSKDGNWNSLKSSANGSTLK